jgi:Protein of unknown function (DUF3768)
VNRPAARAGKGIRPYPARVKLGARRSLGRSLPLPARSPCGPSILPTGRDGAADETGRTTVLDNNTTKIRDLNDSFRRKLVIGGTVLLTPGVTSLPECRVAELLELVREFDQSTPDNDPHSEHDFSAIELGAVRKRGWIRSKGGYMARRRAAGHFR